MSDKGTKSLCSDNPLFLDKDKEVYTSYCKENSEDDSPFHFPYHPRHGLFILFNDIYIFNPAENL